MKKDREKDREKSHDPGEGEKALKKAAEDISQDDEVTMSFVARKLKDSCSD